jgi:putative membrane-bound dehydrogenase-like protein
MLFALALCLASISSAQDTGSRSPGQLPTAPDGRPLNLDFETGTLRDWQAEGSAFERQPVEGDTVAPRRSDMKSDHQGRYWIGTFERAGDPPTGTLTSIPFQVTAPWASFLLAGGRHDETCVELVRSDTEKPFFRASGDETENLKRVVVDLKDHEGKEIFIRLVDQHSGPWGHINFDDFRFHATKPTFPSRDLPPPPDVYTHASLSPEEAAKAMTVPPGFKVTLFAGEPDVVQPIAMTIDERGRLWVAEAYSYPRRVPDEEAKDRILIFEDADNDGHFDKRTVFTEKLNLVSGIEVGFGGVWVGAAPYLMFIPDKDKDDKPDGPPQILLDGWAMQDTHETLNSFIWGPDGWLYGCHGVFTHSNVGKPGAPDSERTRINAGIWRYHPTKHRFELFAEGTSNPWGVDFTATGQCIIEACVIPHLFHMVQGGRFERQAGQHFNPYTYDDIKTNADHRHYVGANPHAGNNRSDSMGGGHAHSGLMIYNGGAWPEEYTGSVFMNNIHGARLNRDILTPKGSGLIGSHKPDFLLANDAWSQIVNLRAGPDGNVYMIDWYDKNQCHRNEVEMHDRTNGRIFKVVYEAKTATTQRLLQADENQLLQALLQSEFVAPATGPLRFVRRNAWASRTARRLLQERGLSDGGRDALVRLVLNGVPAGVGGGGLEGKAQVADALDEPRRLEALWALHVTGHLHGDLFDRFVRHTSPYLRAWTIQLACEDSSPLPPGEVGRRPGEGSSTGSPPSAETLKTFAQLAKNDPSPIVRLYLASALQRLPLDHRWNILDALLQHPEDADDHNLPLMYWYAAEPLAAADLVRALDLAIRADIPILLPFMSRRIASLGTPESLAMLVGAIDQTANPSRRLRILRGLGLALQGRRHAKMPESWPCVFGSLSADPHPELRALAVALGTTFGDPQAIAILRTTLDDNRSPTDRRLEALAALVRVRVPELVPTLHRLVRFHPNLRAEALRALAAYDDSMTPEIILRTYPDLDAAQKRDALATLAARPAYAAALLDAVAAKTVPSADLSAELIRNLGNLKDEQINKRIAEVWGAVRDTPADKAKLIDQYRAIIRRGYSDRPDPMLGRAVYAKTCGQCHMIFGNGPTIGPDLTGSNRADLEYVLSNVLDPSALVGKDYQATIVALSDGRTLTGIIEAEDDSSLTLATATETLVLPKADIEERQLTDQSLMPEDQWANLKDHDIRSLVAYLASPTEVPLLATAENAAQIYSGRDLTGWRGKEGLWTVESGEIVGRTSGLDRNEFLISDIAAADFHFSCQVKLVDNAGNSGIQFRSEALPDGEVKGYQADIGPGWWGKLYEEHGRELLWDKSGESHIKPGEWNTYEIIANGSRIVTKINGHVCVDLDDTQGAARGIFALQLHSGGPTEVRFKDLKLELNPSAN